MRNRPSGYCPGGLLFLIYIFQFSIFEGNSIKGIVKRASKTIADQDNRKTYHRVYSMDCSPNIENHAKLLALSPEELLIRDEDEATMKLALTNLAVTMALLSPIQARRLHARYALNKKFREIAEVEGISGSGASNSVNSAVKKLQKFFIKNGWMPKAVS